MLVVGCGGMWNGLLQWENLVLVVLCGCVLCCYFSGGSIIVCVVLFWCMWNVVSWFVQLIELLDRIDIVNSVVFVVLVLLIVNVVMGMFFGICMIECSELIFFRYLFVIGMLSIGIVVFVVSMLGRCVVLLVFVMIVCSLCLCVFFVQLNILLGIWCVDMIFVLYGMLNFCRMVIVCFIMFQLEFEFISMLMSGVLCVWVVWILFMLYLF